MASFYTMFGQRGSILVVYQEYKFRKTEETSGGVKWRCTEKKCSSSIFLDTAMSVVLKTNINHNHELPKNLTREKVSNSVKRKAMEVVSERPLKLIRNEITAADVSNLTTTDINYIRNNVNYARRSVLPALPKDIDDLQCKLNTMDIKTIQNENFMLCNNKVSKIVVLSCKSNLEFLTTCETVFVDGTFDYCPKYFTQLFSIHGLKNGHYVPAVFCLLPNKSCSTYEETFKSVIDICASNNLNFQPSQIVCDFEIAIHQAIKVIFKHTTIKGCRFHLTQSWWRKIQKLGLTAEYKDNSSEVGKWLHLTFALSLLKPEHVGDCFVFDLVSSMPQNDKITKYADYLIENYVSESAVFPPMLWASPCLDDQTTNACESFHSKYNSYFYSAHPNIYVFIDMLKNIQNDTYIKINSIKNNIKPRQCTKKIYRRRKLYVEEKIKLYLLQQITMIDYVKSVTYYLKQ